MPTHIITRNVLSQALSWANAPKIIHADYSRHTLVSENNTACQQVWLTFDRWHLHHWLTKTDHADVMPRTTAIVAALQDCFCADVQIIAAQYVSSSATVRVSALLTVGQER